MSKPPTDAASKRRDEWSKTMTGDRGFQLPFADTYTFISSASLLQTPKMQCNIQKGRLI